MTGCPICKTDDPEDRYHFMVGFFGDSNEALVIWECSKIGSGQFQRQVQGEDAAAALQEWNGRGSG